MANIDRKDIKKNAKINLKRNYWICVVVAFITVVVLGGGYYYTTNTIAPKKQNSEMAENNDFIQTSIGYTNADLVNKVLDQYFKTRNKEKTIDQNEEKIEQVNKGILSGVINQFSSKRISVGIINSFSILIFENDIHSFIVSLIFTIISIIFFFLIKNVITIGKIRFFLEQRRYNTKIGTILFPYKIKKTLHYAWILFCKYVFEFLWMLTIIGGVIKYYEYFFIPYTIAENPEINRKQAFKLSKELSQNLKWKMFKLDLSMIRMAFVRNLYIWIK